MMILLKPRAMQNKFHVFIHMAASVFQKCVITPMYQHCQCYSMLSQQGCNIRAIPLHQKRRGHFRRCDAYSRFF